MTGCKDWKPKRSNHKMPPKCMVCGKPTKPMVPLNFCETCKFTPEADAIRKRHHERMLKIFAERDASNCENETKT